MAHFTAAERALAQILIDSVDEGGYLRASTYEIADRLGCGLPKVEAVLKTCQGFDPTVFLPEVFRNVCSYSS